MIKGINRIYQHGEQSFHIQCEDLGLDSAAFEVRICDAGSILWQKRFAYGELLAKGLAKPEQDQAILGLMEKKVQTVEAAISQGKLP